MPSLVAIPATGGSRFVDRLRKTWARGDAVLPVDPRLPEAARAALEAELRVGDDVADGDALVVATSGTTGTPKGVVLTHAAVEASARATSARLEVDPCTDSWLACLPLAHVGGLSVVTRALVTGTELVVHKGFDPVAAMTSGTTLVSLVPTALARLDSVSMFRRIVLGGSAMPDDLPANAVTTYGMTETGSGIVYDGVPLDGVTVRVDDVTGEISVAGPMLVRAYRSIDGERDPKDAEGWFPTGDVGSWDGGAQRLIVFGRRDDLVITGGENVWPAAVEDALRHHPGVADVAVVGRPDPEWGQILVAMVVPVRASRPPRLEDLRAVVKDVLPPWCAPKVVEIVPSLPRTNLGKLQRSRL